MATDAGSVTIPAREVFGNVTITLRMIGMRRQILRLKLAKLFLWMAAVVGGVKFVVVE